MCIKTPKQVYEQYKHLDKELSDPTLIEEDDFKHQILYDLWQAIRSNVDCTIIIPKEALEWLKTGEGGISRKAIFTHLTGVSIVGCWGLDVPADPDDFANCRKLLERVPEFQKRFHEMETASIGWAAMVEYWDELCKIMDEEAPSWRTAAFRCPKTYERMRVIISKAAQREMRDRKSKNS